MSQEENTTENESSMDLKVLLQLRKRKGLSKTVSTVRTTDGIICLDIGGTLYELRTKDGSTVVKNEINNETQYCALKMPDGSSIVLAKQGGKNFYFRRVFDEALSYFEDHLLKHWYGFHYIETDVNPEMVPINIQTDLVLYTLNDDERPRMDVIEGTINPNLFEIISGYNLYLGSQDAATNEQGLLEKNVRHILNVATGIEYRESPNIIYCKVPVLDLDSVDIIPIFEQCFEFIHLGRREGGILVHCNQGVSRSATVVIAYIMKHEKLPLEEALKLTKKAKPDIKPNPGFLEQLKLYEKTLN